MDFRLSDAQTALRDSVRSYLDDAHPPSELRQLDHEGGRNEKIWRGLADIGLPAMLVPEAAGGLGLTLVEGALIAVELGRADVGCALADTCLVAAPWLARHGDTGALADIAAGTRRVALAHTINPWIADLDQADAVLTAAGLVPPPLTTIRLESVDPLRRLFAPVPASGADDLLLNLAALMAAAQMLGAAERMLTQATDYAKVRKQFGSRSVRFRR